MYHRNKAEDVIMDSNPNPRIVIKPSQRKGQNFEDNSIKMPYRFNPDL